MGKKRLSVEAIVAMLREADVMIGKGLTVPEVLKQLNISDACPCSKPRPYGFNENSHYSKAIFLFHGC